MASRPRIAGGLLLDGPPHHTNRKAGDSAMVIFSAVQLPAHRCPALVERRASRHPLAVAEIAMRYRPSRAPERVSTTTGRM